MSGSELFTLDDADAKKFCVVVTTASGAISGGIVGGVYSAGTAGAAGTAGVAGAATMGTGGLILLFLGGALIGLAAGRYFCGSIVDNVKNQSASMSAEDLRKFGIVMGRYGTFTNDELLILAKLGYYYNSINTTNQISVLPEPTDRLRNEITALLAAYSGSTLAPSA